MIYRPHYDIQKLSMLLHWSKDCKRTLSLGMFNLVFFFCLLAPSVRAANYPNLTLPWGTWQATKYDLTGDVSRDF